MATKGTSKAYRSRMTGKMVTRSDRRRARGVEGDRDRSVEPVHAGPTVMTITMAPCICAGAGLDDEREMPDMEGYSILDRQQGHSGPEISLCRKCAVTLALKLFELECM